MQRPAQHCPDCDRLPADPSRASRREFLKVTAAASAAAVATTTLPFWATAAEVPASAGATPESLVKVLYESLKDEQRQAVCFDWDYQEPQRGLLRTRVANNWHITKPEINSKFFTRDQQALVRQIFEGTIQPDWHKRIDQQLDDDAGGFGNEQNIAIFGKPGDGKFEFVMTGRHMTLRCDGNTADHLAFGGPIFYGHAAAGFNEPANHEGNVFWPQALEANKLFPMLDGKQQKIALVEKMPVEQQVAFRGAGQLPGIPVTELSSDQKEQVQNVLQKLLEPYRQSDRDEVATCLKAQGGLDHCSLAFYKEGDIGNDRVWDCWRLEGPAFVWYFRGTPHVHVWVNVADDPSVATNAG
ncbi:MAG: hypothetical protein B7Z73_12315 [Planctomycetia bacterium 21-64-5]|nr:MAG: hypothetical protein B7Z73_12315 [Planctomycetia bacterium 21-64-5]HQU46710.1 DUF3500 domain-containing protein [Pirellulales bacterium]